MICFLKVIYNFILARMGKIMMASGKITDYFGIEGGRQTVLRWFQKF